VRDTMKSKSRSKSAMIASAAFQSLTYLL